MKRLFFLLLGLSPFVAIAQSNEDSLFIARIFDEALTKGKSYPDLQELCKQAGQRLSG